MPLVIMSRWDHVSVIIVLIFYLWICLVPGAGTRHIHKMLFHFRIVIHNCPFHLFDQIRHRDTAWAGIRTIENCATAPDPIVSSQDCQALGTSLVAAIEDEAVSIHNGCWPDPIWIAPDGGAGTCAGPAQDALGSLVIAFPLFRALQAFRSRLRVMGNQVRLHGDVFFKERVHINDQVFDHREAKHRLDRYLVADITHQHLAGQAVATIDAHGIRTTYSMCAGASIGQRTILCPLNCVQCIEQPIDWISLNLVLCPVRLLFLLRVEALNTYKDFHTVSPNISVPWA